VVCVKKKGMKEPWCLATSLGESSGAEVVALYAGRFTIEESFSLLSAHREADFPWILIHDFRGAS